MSRICRYIYETQQVDRAYSSSGRVCLYAHRLLDGGVGIVLTLTGVNSLFLYPNLVQLATTALMVRKIHQLLRPYHRHSGSVPGARPGGLTSPRQSDFSLTSPALTGGRNCAQRRSVLPGANGSDCELVDLGRASLGKKFGSAPEFLLSGGDKGVNAFRGADCRGSITCSNPSPMFSIGGQLNSVDSINTEITDTATPLTTRLQRDQFINSASRMGTSSSTQNAGYRLAIALGESGPVSGDAGGSERVIDLPLVAVSDREGEFLTSIAEERRTTTTTAATTTTCSTNTTTTTLAEADTDTEKEMAHVQSNRRLSTRNSAPELVASQRRPPRPLSRPPKSRSASTGKTQSFRRVRTQQQTSDGSSSIVAREMRATLTLVAIVLTRLLFYLPLTILWTFHFTNLPERSDLIS